MCMKVWKRKKNEFSRETWEKIEEDRVGGSVNFFFDLFNIMAGGDYHYYNIETSENVKENKESQAAAKAFHDTDVADVKHFIHLTMHFYR